MFITPDREPIGEFEFGTPFGVAGLRAFRLVIPIIWNLWDIKVQAALDGIGGEVEMIFDSGERHYIGNLEPAYGAPHVLILGQTSPSMTQHKLLLSAEQIEAIEGHRAGGSLHLQLSIWAVVRADGRSSAGKVERQCHIEQGAWLRILEQMDYRRTLLLEIPAPSAEDAPEFASAVSFLEEARGALLRGKYRDAVGSCRDALDVIRSLTDESSDATRHPRERSKEQRFRDLRKCLFDVASAARHADEHTVGMEWLREDAVALLTMVGAELRRSIQCGP